MGKKKISINFAYQVAYQLLTIITPLITTPYIARVLGPTNNGLYTYSFTVVNYFVVFSSLGIEAYGNRLVAQSRANGKDELNKAFSSLFCMHFIVGGIATVAYFLYCLCLSQEYKSIALAQSIWIISALIDINWLFFGLEEFRLTVIRNFFIKLTTVVAIIIFVKSESDLLIYVVVVAIGTLVSNVILWRFINGRVKFIKVKWTEIVNHLKPLLVLFLAVIATSIYRMIDKIMLGWYSDMPSLASYEYADKMIKLVITLITAMGTVMLPRMSALYAEGKEEQAAKYMSSTSQFMFVMAFALAFGLAGIANEFMPMLLGDGYDGAALLTNVLCLSIPIMGWNNLIRTQVLIPKEKDKVYTIAVWAGAVVNIVLNFFLIKLFGAIGAAIATVLAYAIVGLFQTLPIRKIIPVGSYLKYIFIPLLSGIMMYLFVRMVGSFFDGGVACIALEIVVGIIVYCSINMFYLYRTQNDIYFNYIGRVRKKLHLSKEEDG